jgi:hypothetical protein
LDDVPQQRGARTRENPMIKSTRTTSRLAVLGLAALTMSMTACGGSDDAESVSNDDSAVILETESAPAADSSSDPESSVANASASSDASDEDVATAQSNSSQSTSQQSSVGVAEAPAEEPAAEPQAGMPTEEYAEAPADDYTAEETVEAETADDGMDDEEMMDDEMTDAYDDVEEPEVTEEEQVLAEPVAADDGGDAATKNDQHRLTVEPDQAATGFEAVSYRDGVGDRGDRWSITASKDFFDSTKQSATMIIQIICPEGGIWVHQGAVRDGYNPRSGASPQECSGAVTLTEFVGYQSNQVGFTVYLPDGVEGYFPYTVVASAA